jgi:hypothetical protein
MEIQENETEEKRLMPKTILYGILIIVVVLAAAVLVAKFAFNIDLLNLEQLSGAVISKTQLIKLQK